MLFENPISKRIRRKGTNYNQVLNFDEDEIFCGDRNISYPDLINIYKINATECRLKTGKSIQLSELVPDLLSDYSFKYSNKIEENQ